nr:hypothetical protein [uncultured bacterium]
MPIARRLIAVLLLLFGSGLANAFGLGEANVKSFLNQPLEVEINLLSLTQDEANSVIASLATLDDYRRVGINEIRLTVPLTFTVFVTNSRTFILIQSTQPVREPVLQLLLDVNWSGGRLLKEYTLFLDPPTLGVAPPRVITPPGAVTSPPPAEVTPRPIQQAPPPVEAAPATAPRVVAAGEAYGPVQSGETLWRIASDYIEQSGHSVNQAMVMIALANPEAFRNGNINRLQRGAILRMPTLRQVGQISRADANTAVADQTDAWRRNLPEPPPPPIISDSGADVDSSSTAVDDAAVDDTAVDDSSDVSTPPPLPEARLELVPTDLDTDGAGSGETATEREQRAQLQLVQQLLSEAEQELRTTSVDNEALETEVEDLRNTVLELTRAMNLDDADLAALAARTRESRLRDQAAAETLDDLLQEAQQGVTGVTAPESSATEDATTDASIPPTLDVPPVGKRPWWEETWFIVFLAAFLMTGIVLLLRRGGKSAKRDYGTRSLADSLLDAEQEEEHVDYSASDIPGVSPEPLSDDLSVLTEDAENILKALEEENQELRSASEDSIYSPDEPADEHVVGSDGTTVSTLNLDDDELAELMGTAAPEDDGEKDEDGGVPSGEDPNESKLDLAISYLESEKPDKARALLEEILEDGDDAQQKIAREILDKL